jgi:hypothetical protein
MKPNILIVLASLSAQPTLTIAMLFTGRGNQHKGFSLFMVFEKFTTGSNSGGFMKNITEVLIMLFAVMVLMSNSYAGNDSVPTNVGNPSSNEAKDKSKEKEVKGSVKEEKEKDGKEKR